MKTACAHLHPAPRYIQVNTYTVSLCLQLSEALQASSQTQAELNLQQKLRQDSELRMEEMEESLMEKEQELQRQQNLISRLQGEVWADVFDLQDWNIYILVYLMSHECYAVGLGETLKMMESKTQRLRVCAGLREAD